MKKQQLTPFRKFDKRFRLKEKYIIKIKKAKNGDLIIPLPKEIVKAYDIEIGDIAVFNIIDKNCFMIRFVKKAMQLSHENLKMGG